MSDEELMPTSYPPFELKQNLSFIIHMCEQYSMESTGKTRSFDDNIQMLIEIAEICIELHNDYSEEYKIYELGQVALNLVAPMIRESLNSWNPLFEPLKPFPLFVHWRIILAKDVYEKFVWISLIPSVDCTIMELDFRRPEPMVDLIRQWRQMLPRSIYDYILIKLVIPKLMLQVEEWNPLYDMIPTRRWLLPWFPFLGIRMNTLLFPIIHNKLVSTLHGWYPSERSFRIIVQSWAEVFTKGGKEAFAEKDFGENLPDAVLDWLENPFQQNSCHWKWAFEWDMLPIDVKSSMLDQFFFPKWLRVLGALVNHSSLPHEEIRSWYMGWKRIFDNKGLLANPIIHWHFQRALALINRAEEFPHGFPPYAGAG
ncbi:tuftelin-interacting protein 11-like [Prorops nasuta]|uniref:tuftelin-interacting protein 11-like n=1 Tax=Prorops nasuta TaxID=863751 RepID=UPI0034CEC13F